MSTEYKNGVREEFDRRLTMVPRKVLDSFTGKPILDVSVRFPRSDGVMECLLDVHHRKWTS